MVCCVLREWLLCVACRPTRSTSALTEYGQHREIVEDADFEALEWKLRGVTVSCILSLIKATLQLLLYQVCVVSLLVQITDSLQALFTKL